MAQVTMPEGAGGGRRGRAFGGRRSCGGEAEGIVIGARRRRRRRGARGARGGAVAREERGARAAAGVRAAEEGAKPARRGACLRPEGQRM